MPTEFLFFSYIWEKFHPQTQATQMKTIIFQTDAQSDLDLLIAFAQRLGIQCFEADPELDIAAATPITTHHHTAAEMPDSSALYEGLGLDEEVQVCDYDTFTKENKYPEIVHNFNAVALANTLSEVGGAWEDDDEETLEDLLNMLTP